MTPTEEAALRALATKDWMTKKDLMGVTGGARRTLYLVCRNLLASGHVKARPSLKDTRQTYYAITDLGRSVVQ